MSNFLRCLLISSTVCLGAISCNVHSLNKRDSPVSCRKIYQMFQDKNHWKFDNTTKRFTLSNHLAKAIQTNTSQEQLNKESSCFHLLTQEELIIMSGKPSRIVQNSRRWQTVQYDLVSDCQGDLLVCKQLIFFFDESGFFRRMVISTRVVEKD